MMKPSILCLAVLLGGATFQAEAVDLLSTHGAGASGNCQAALPVFDGLVRKRPLAVVNEGDGEAFVTCALLTQEVSLNVNAFNQRVSNQSAAPLVVSCTAVIGEEFADASYITKSLALPAGGQGTLQWTTADNGGLLFAKSIALSCRLPPGASLNRNRVSTLLSLL